MKIPRFWAMDKSARAVTGAEVEAAICVRLCGVVLLEVLMVDVLLEVARVDVIVRVRVDVTV